MMASVYNWHFRYLIASGLVIIIMEEEDEDDDDILLVVAVGII